MRGAAARGGYCGARARRKRLAAARGSQNASRIWFAPGRRARSGARADEFGFGFYTTRDPLVAPAPPGPIRRARTE